MHLSRIDCLADRGSLIPYCIVPPWGCEVTPLLSFILLPIAVAPERARVRSSVRKAFRKAFRKTFRNTPPIIREFRLLNLVHVESSWRLLRLFKVSSNRHALAESSKTQRPQHQRKHHARHHRSDPLDAAAHARVSLLQRDELRI